MNYLENQELQNNNSNEFLSKQLDAEDVPERIATDLRGQWFDPETRKYTNILYYDENNKPVHSVAKLNEQGIRDICTEIRARIRNVYGSANLTGEQIRSIRMGIARAVWLILRVNRTQYNLKVENMMSILFMIDDQILLFLSRTEKGGFWSGLGRLFGLKQNVNYNYSDMPKGIDPTQQNNTKRGIF